MTTQERHTAAAQMFRDHGATEAQAARCMDVLREEEGMDTARLFLARPDVEPMTAHLLALADEVLDEGDEMCCPLRASLMRLLRELGVRPLSKDARSGSATNG
jgi:hypothetical protein